jgi:hypothetical protein
MERAVAAALADEPAAEGLVLDASDLRYEWGDRIGGVVPGEGLPCVWAVSTACPGLVSYVTDEMDQLPGEWLFEPLERALTVVAERCRHDYDLHSFSGELATRVVHEPRGQRVVSVDEGVARWESTWFRRRLVERLHRDAQGELEWQTLFPVVDGEGGASLACELDAVVRFERGELAHLDFGRQRRAEGLFDEQEVSPRVDPPADWLATLSCYGAALRSLGLDGTTVTDADVATALKRCPRLQDLTLNGSAVTTAVLDRLLLAPMLRRVELYGVSLAEAELRAFVAAHPTLRVGSEHLFRR